jgi:acyl-CoA thioesterase-1
MNVKALATGLLMTGLAFTSASAQDRAEPLMLVGFGDSLMAGYELSPNDAFPLRLEAALRERGYSVEISNAGVSGDTTAAGLARLDWSVPEGTDGVILELGANDALRGVDPASTERNLDAMLARLKERGIPVLLAGMIAPPNMGAGYGDRFNPIYERLAEKYDVPLYPFFLDGVAGQAALNLQDGIHPNEDGIAIMVERFLPAAEAFIADLTEENAAVAQ